MKAIWIIAKRELRVFFDSLIAYILIFLLFAAAGLFTWHMGGDVFLSKEASMKPFFDIAFILMLFFIPALTMRMLAEESKAGTIELLLTKAITDWQVILGKYLSVILLVIIALLLSLPYYFAIAWLGPIDHGSVWIGYIGLILVASAFAGIGIFASSITNNQIVAFLLALLICVIFFPILNFIGSTLSGTIGSIVNYLGVQEHFASLSRGVLDSRDIFYFLSITALGLIAAEAVLSKRKIAK